MAVKATTTAIRNNRKFKIPGDLRELAGGGSQMRRSEVEDGIQEEGEEGRREFDARVGAFLQRKTIKRKPIKTLRIDGRERERNGRVNEGGASALRAMS